MIVGDLPLGPQAGGCVGHNACLGSVRQRLLQSLSDCGQLFWLHQLLHFFKQLAFFLADVGREFFHHGLQAGYVESASPGAGKEIAQQRVAGKKFLNERLQLGKARGGREQFLLLGRKMKRDFLFKDLLDLRLPCLKVNVAGLAGFLLAKGSFSVQKAGN